MIHKLAFIFLVMLMNSTAVSAWFFGSSLSVVKANEQPVDESCVAKGEAGDCEFYSCLESRLPCGPDGFALRYGLHYCRRFLQAFDGFTPAGQTFLNASAQCLTKSLVSAYRQPSVDCHRLSHAAFDTVSTCYANHAFCEVLRDNAPLFVDAFQPRHLFQNGALKIWREILEISYHCDPQSYHSIISNANSLAGKLVNILTEKFIK